MTDADFVRSIAKVYDFFTELGIERNFRSPNSLPVNQDFNTVALDTSVLYEDVFVCALRLGHFNIQLKDFSIFQFSKVGDEVRLCFYPAPFGPQEFFMMQKVTDSHDAGAIDFETYCYFLEGVKFNSRRPLIRYEYSTEQYERGVHPASHFHLGTYGEDRWVCERILSPMAFALLIGRLYFLPDWEAVTQQIAEDQRSNEFDDRYFKEKVECAVSDVQHFSEFERGQFHFA